MERSAFVISLPVMMLLKCHDHLTPVVPPKKMLHFGYPLRHSTYFTKTDHVWTSELPVSTFIVYRRIG